MTRKKLRITPAAHAAICAHRAEIGGSYSAAACSLILRGEAETLGRRQRCESILMRASKHLGKAMACAHPTTIQYVELRGLLAAIEEIQKLIA